MGVEIKKHVLIVVLFLFATGFYAQKKEDVKDLKIYALCSCVNKNYSSIDSTFYSADVTNAYILQHAPLSIEKFEKFDQFIKANTSLYYKEFPYGSYDAPKANMVFSFCMKFYESKGLDKFIKKLIKEQD